MTITLDTVLDAVRTHVLTLGLPLTPVKHKAGKFEDGLDTKPLLGVHRSEGKPEQITRWASRGATGGGYFSWTYRVTLSFIGANGNDQATTLANLTSWRDTLCEAFKSKPTNLMGLDGLRDVRCKPAEFLPDTWIDKYLDVSLVDVEVEVIKPN